MASFLKRLNLYFITFRSSIIWFQEVDSIISEIRANEQVVEVVFITQSAFSFVDRNILPSASFNGQLII